jgi:formyl-CoA transferase
MAYRGDDGTRQAWDTGTSTPYPDDIVATLLSGVAPIADDDHRAQVKRFSATLVNHLFLLYFDTRAGYGDTGPYAARKAYDMLIQAEAGVASVTGGPEAPARVGVSVCDIGAGMNAYEAVLEALIARGRTGEGTAISVSMFDGMADWMTTPLLQHEGGVPPKRIGLAHTSISPYGVFKSKDGADILISIQSDREWRVLAEKVLGDKALAADPNFATNIERVKRRSETDGKVAAAFGALDVDALVEKLAAADIAFGRVNGPAELARHPHLRRIEVGSPGGPLSYPAPAAQWAGETRTYGPVPGIGEHSEKIRAEFKR